MTPVSVRSLLTLVALAGALGFALVACSSPPPAGPTPGTPVTETVPPGGTTLTAEDGAGNRLALAFPAGAVSRPLELTVTPLAPGSGGAPAFRIEPAGVVLTEPVELTLALAPGAALPAGAVLAFGASDPPATLPTTVDRDARTLRAATPLLGYGDGAGGPGLAGQRLTGQQGAFDEVTLAEIECQIELESLAIAFEQAKAFPFGSAQSAKMLADRILVFRQVCENGLEDPDAAAAFIAQVRADACAELKEAETSAQVVPIETREQFVAAVRGVVTWTANAMAAGASDGDCLDDWQGTTKDAADRFIDVFTDKVQSPNYTSDYNEIWNDFRATGFPLLEDTMMLGLEDGSNQIQVELIPALAARLRSAAYRACRDGDGQGYLLDMVTDGNLMNHPVPQPALRAAGRLGSQGTITNYADFSDAQLLADLQLCATAIEIQVWTPVEHLSELDERIAGGAEPDAHDSGGTIRSPVAGALVLQGSVRALDCLQPGGLDNSELLVTLDGSEVARRQHSGGDLLASPIDLDTETVLADVGIDPEDHALAAAPVELELIRDGPVCQGIYGFGTTTLGTFEITFDPAPDVTGATASPASLTADQSAEVQVSLPFEDGGANQTRLIAVFELAGSSETLAFELDAPEVTGFDGEEGTGSYTDSVFIGCSEAPASPLTVTLKLEDAFDQTGDEATATLPIDYSGCDAGAAAPAARSASAAATPPAPTPGAAPR